MPVQQELLNGGLVTARDASLLNEGELTQADDCILRPRTPAVWKAGGRTRFGLQPSGASGAVLGLRHLAFDYRDDLLLAQVGAKLYTAPYTGTGLTGAWSPQIGVYASGTDEDYLDIVQYSGAFYILNANNNPYRLGYTVPKSIVLACTIAVNGTTVTSSGAAPFLGIVVGQAVSGGTVPAGAVVTAVTSSTSIEITTSPAQSTTLTFAASAFPTTRPAGLSPVATWVTGSVAVVAGSWPTFAGAGAGVYWFLYTEMVMPGLIDDENSGFVESGFIGTSQAVTIATPLTQGVTVTRGNVVNTAAYSRANATHWQVYMSGPTTDATTTPSLATFQRVSTPIVIAQTSVTLTNTLDYQIGIPTANDILGTGTAVAFAPQGVAFTNPSGAYTMGTGGIATSVAGSQSNIVLSGFGLGTGSGRAVVGMQMQILAYATPFTAIAYAQVATLSALKFGITYSMDVNTTTYFRSLQYGDAANTMSPSPTAWLEADAPNLCVIISIPAAVQTLVLDEVRLLIFYTTTQINKNGVFFRVVTATSQAGVSIAATANLPPPIATTGDIYDGQLVLNNLARPAVIQYSLPDKPEYFPALYYINFESKYKDSVTCIRRVNNALVVGLQSSIKRVNFLPRESDAEFDRGRAQEDITTDHGIAGPQAATLFTLPGVGTLLAYVSSKGIHITDGNTSRELNSDLDWAATLNLGVDGNDTPYLERCMLVNYASEYALRLAYVPYGGTTVSKYLQFSYHPLHLKNGQLPAMGPCSMNARSFCSAILGGTSKILSGHLTDGYVYVEDNGTESADTAALQVPAVKTRLLLPRGIGGQGRIQRVYFRVGAYGAGDAITGTGRFTVGSQRQNINEAVTTAAAPIGLSTTTGGTVVAHVDTFGEGLILSIGKPATATSAMRLDMIAYQVEDGGQESHRTPV